jgi:hypothetical protein
MKIEKLDGCRSPVGCGYEKMLKMKDEAIMCMKTQALLTKCPLEDAPFSTKNARIP